MHVCKTIILIYFISMNSFQKAITTIIIILLLYCYYYYYNYMNDLYKTKF